MLARLRACDPSEPLGRIILYRVCRKICAVFVRVFYRLRVVGLKHAPRTGGFLLVSNHQSHLDPPLLGTALKHRNMAALARQGLFNSRIFGALLRGLGSIPINQSAGDTAAIRATIAALRKGRVVLVFPEGSRSPDGELQDFKRGTWLLMSRAECLVLPAAVEGAFQVWPRTRVLPRLFGQRCAVAFGEPIPAAKLKAMGAEEGLAHLRGVIEELRSKAKNEG